MSKDFFSEQDQQRILATVQQAETNTSGEVRVFIENKCKKPVMDRATEVFNILGMSRTAQHNGVLFYLAVKDKKFAILGDIGIHQKVSENFWDEIKEHMQRSFREGRFTDGLCDGVKMAGEQLGKHFPYQNDDVNELPDDITFGNN